MSVRLPGYICLIWVTGVATTDAGSPVANATVALHSKSEQPEYHATTSPNGTFTFAEIKPGSYRVSVEAKGKVWTAPEPFVVPENAQLNVNLQLSSQGQSPKLLTPSGQVSTEATGGLRLSSKQVSNLPLNERDFSKLLLLAAGTMTDTNGAANFTQQFSINGQRGITAVFATDGTDSSDPELGGATFPNFKVDAIQEVKSSPGVMPQKSEKGPPALLTPPQSPETTIITALCLNLCAMQHSMPAISLTTGG